MAESGQPDPDKGDLGAAKDDATLAGELFSGAKAADALSTPPPAETAETTAEALERAAAVDQFVNRPRPGDPLSETMAARAEETKFKDLEVGGTKRYAEKQGCSPKLIAAIGVGVALVAGLVFNLVKDNGKSTTKTDASSGAQPGAPAGGAADFTSFAGHYVMSTGLDQPFAGDAEFIVDKNAYPSVTPGPGSASFDIDANGKITAGEYHASYRAVKPSIDCTFTFDSTKATGSIGMTGPGALGQIAWDGVLSISGQNCATGYPTQIPRQIGIVGPDALMCGTNLEPSLTACKVVGAQASVAKFARQ